MSQRPRRILFLHCCDSRTIDIVVYHLQGFAHCGAGDEIFFQDIRMPVTPELRGARFDAAILNFEALAHLRYGHRVQGYIDKLSFIRETCAVRIAITMDDYTGAGYLDRFLVAMGVQHVHTPLPDHVAALYPQACAAGVAFHGTQTGYLDDAFVGKAGQFHKPWGDREIYFGNRIRYLPPHFGRWARMKGDMNARFGEILEARGHEIDLSFRAEDRIEGDDWVRWLCSMKFMVNPLGGASLIDRHHELIEATGRYQRRHPKAGFDEIEAACFPGQDGRHIMKAAGPRLIQAAVCGVVQLMPRDDYPADLRPGEDYIVLEPDMSNAGEALAVMADEDRCREIARSARERVLACREVWFDSFVTGVLANIPAEVAAALPGAQADPLTGAQGHFERLHDQAREIVRAAGPVPPLAAAVLARLVADCIAKGGLELARRACRTLAGAPAPPGTSELTGAVRGSNHGRYSAAARAARMCAGFALCFPGSRARDGLCELLMELPEAFAEMGGSPDLKYCIGVRDGSLIAPETLQVRTPEGGWQKTRRGEVVSFVNNASGGGGGDLPADDAIVSGLADARPVAGYAFAAVLLHAGRRRKTQQMTRRLAAAIDALPETGDRQQAAAGLCLGLDLAGDPAASAQIHARFGLADPALLARLSWRRHANAKGRVSPLRLLSWRIGHGLNRLRDKVRGW